MHRERRRFRLCLQLHSAGYTRELDVGKKEAFYQKIQGLSDGVQIDENGKVQVQ